MTSMFNTHPPLIYDKFERKLWIYEIMTSMFNTHPPLIYVLISFVKEIRFWNQNPPTFYADVLKIAYLVFYDSHSLSTVYSLSFFLLVFLCVDPFVCLSFWLSGCPSVSLSVFLLLTVRMSFCLSVCPSDYQAILLSGLLTVRLSFCLFLCFLF